MRVKMNLPPVQLKSAGNHQKTAPQITQQVPEKRMMDVEAHTRNAAISIHLANRTSAATLPNYTRHVCSSPPLRQGDSPSLPAFLKDLSSESTKR